MNKAKPMTIEELKDIERRIREGRHYTERDLFLLTKEVESLMNEIISAEDKISFLNKEVSSLQNELFCMNGELFKLSK
jgi:chromosome segregation ATPase